MLHLVAYMKNIVFSGTINHPKSRSMLNLNTKLSHENSIFILSFSFSGDSCFLIKYLAYHQKTKYLIRPNELKQGTFINIICKQPANGLS